MLRIKTKKQDIAIIVVYGFQNPQNTTEHRRNDRLWEHVDGILCKLPARCIPIVLGDFNAHVGHRLREHATDRNRDEMHIGQYANGVVDTNGLRFESMLLKHHLTAANTHYDLTPSYYGCRRTKNATPPSCQCATPPSCRRATPPSCRCATPPS